ncbi:MAG: hypothetical protein ACPGJS_16805 [Flammeovirgaceae bacterium]
MIIIGVSPIDAQEASLKKLWELLHLIKALCLRFAELRESNENSVYTPPQNHPIKVSPRTIMNSIFSYCLVYAAFYLDLSFSSDVSTHFGVGDNPYRLAFITLAVEIILLFLIQQNTVSNRLGRYKKKKSPWITLLKLSFLIIPALFLLAKMMAYGLNNTLIYILPTLGMSLLFVVTHFTLIWSAIKGHLFDGLFFPFIAVFNLIRNQMQRKKRPQNIWEIEQQISDAVQDLIAQMQYHVFTFSPNLNDGSVNLEYLAEFPEGDRIGFRYIPFVPQFTARETAIINEVFGRDMFAGANQQTNATNQALGNGDDTNQDMSYSDRAKGLIV